ncbi:hypothetical protein EV650_7060 [Kribbella kalugense]|uniref:Uncharacterized protein n=1 Tax=Kribbella kalugense TaxID=2512221 RepID=A0A4R7ZDB7_9ACTN|nr:hypothetical protein EV650_7060 [Kribbella kalugense]
MGWLTSFVDDAEADVVQCAGELSGTEELCGTGVDQGCVEGFGEPLGDLCTHRVMQSLGTCSRCLDELRDETVAARCQLAQTRSVRGQVCLA